MPHQLQDYTQVQDAASEHFPRHDSPSTMTPLQSLEHTEISTSLSYSNFNGEIDLADNLSQIGCMSPYSSQGNFMDFYGNWDVPYEGYDQINSISYTEPF